MEHLNATVDNFLAEFNNMSKKPMNLVLFRYEKMCAYGSVTEFFVLHC